jgi:hypothetical protein
MTAWAPTAALRVIAAWAALSSSACFLLVSSGIRREVPPGARAAAAPLLRDDERVLAAWDGSVAQDGGLLVVLTDRRVVKRDGNVVRDAPFARLHGIVVDEDEGVVVLAMPEGLLLLPLRTSDERRAFAALIRDAQRSWLRGDDDGDGVRNALDAASDPAGR